MLRALVQTDINQYRYRFTLIRLVVGIAMPLAVVLVSDLSVISGWRIALPVSLIAVGGDPVELAVAAPISLMPLTISILFEQSGWRIVLAILMTGIACNFAILLKMLLQNRCGSNETSPKSSHFTKRIYILSLTMIPYSIPAYAALEFLCHSLRTQSSLRLRT
ncbi:MAG: hypothetical protein ABUS47_01045 [Steroidobacter sp.]